eukprot:6478040-Amphidinium_carterae.1
MRITEKLGSRNAQLLCAEGYGQECSSTLPGVAIAAETGDQRVPLAVHPPPKRMHQDKFNNSQIPTWTISFGSHTQKEGIPLRPMLLQSGIISEDSPTSRLHGWNLIHDGELLDRGSLQHYDHRKKGPRRRPQQLRRGVRWEI